MDEDEREANRKTCGFACTKLCVRCAKDHEDEDEGCYNLNKRCAPDAAGTGNAVCTKAGRIGTQESGSGMNHDFGKQEQEGTGDDTADNLANPIATCLFPAHAAAEGYTKGDGRIDVAAADFTNCVSHSHNGKTEGNSCCKKSGRSAATNKHCCSAAKECKNEGSYAFSDVLFHKLFSFSSCEQI